MRKIGILSILLLSVISPIVYGQVDCNQARWFASDGAYFYGSPLQYINDVLQEKTIDPQVRKMVRDYFPSGVEFPLSQMPGLIQELDKKGENFRIFLPEKKSLKKARKKFEKMFKKNFKAGAMGNLKIQGFGIKTEGKVNLLQGSSLNLAIIIPADPEIIASLPQPSPTTISEITDNMIRLAQKGKWKKYSRVTALSPLGTLQIENLPAGDWLIWINQYNILTYLYFAQVEPGTTAKVQLKRNFAFGTFTTKPEEPKTKN